MVHTEDFDSEDPRSAVLESLISKKAEVEKSLQEMRAYHRENKETLFGNDFLEDIDRAGKEISAQTYYTLLERKGKELERLENLIEHISQNEDFGFCEDCGDEIGHERLLAMPDVTRCIDCQRDFEKTWARENNRLRGVFNQGRKDDWDLDDDSDEFEAPVLRHKIKYMSDDDLEEIELDDITSNGPTSQKSDPQPADPE